MHQLGATFAHLEVRSEDAVHRALVLTAQASLTNENAREKEEDDDEDDDDDEEDEVEQPDPRAAM